MLNKTKQQDIKIEEDDNLIDKNRKRNDNDCSTRHPFGETIAIYKTTQPRKTTWHRISKTTINQTRQKNDMKTNTTIKKATITLTTTCVLQARNTHATTSIQHNQHRYRKRR